MAQQNIDFGSFPDDPSADAIRTAFQKVQNNFNQLFSTNANSTVNSINRTPGAGVTVNYPTGNVVISANIACLQVATTSLKVGRGADNTQSNVTITSSSQQLNIDIDPENVYSNNFAAPGDGLANFNGTLTSNSFYQPNINTLGTLSSLDVSGNANFTGNTSFTSNANFTGANINFSNIANLHIQGGTLGYVLTTDGIGGLSWAAGGGGGNGTPGGVNTYVQFNDEGNFGANLGFTFNKVTGILTVPSLTVSNVAILGNLLGSLANGNSNVDIPSANGNVNISVAGNANVLVVTGVGANIAGNLNVDDKIVANRLEVNLVTGTLTTNAQPNVTSVGTLTSLDVTGNLSSGNANLGNLASANYITGTLTTNAQPNITSTGTLTSLTVTGDANVGNLNVTTDAIINGNLSVLGNATYINIEILEVQDPIISLGGGVNGAPLTSNDGKDRGTALQYYTTAPVTAFMGWDNSNSEFGFGSNVTISSGEVVTFNNYGNIRASYFIGANTEFGNANLGNTATANYFVGRFYGNANAATVANTVVDNAQPNITSVGTLTSLAVTGNTTSGNFIGTLANGNSNIRINADSTIAMSAMGSPSVLVINSTGVNVSGTGNFTGDLSAANLIGPLSNGNSNVNIPSANGNINLTAVGNTTMVVSGTGANINGDLTVTGVSNLGSNANVRITGGIPFDVLLTVDGAGNLAWGTITFESIYNGNSNVYVTQDGNITMYVAGNTTARFTATSTGIVANGTFSVSGNATVDNLSTTGTANVGTLNVTGNVTSNLLPNANVTYDLGSPTQRWKDLYLANSTIYLGNASITANGNAITTSGNTTAVNLIATGSLSVTGNANVGNLGTARVLATANITAPQIISNVATGTSPLVVTSTTQVANLNVATAGLATYATTANAVAGANVSGTVANATYAVSAGSATTAGTVTTAAQPNITSVGTLTSLSSSGNITGANVTVTGFHIRSVGTGISAAGSTQGTGTALTKEINIVSSVSSGQGVVLPTAVAGMIVTVTNTTGTTLTVYPASGGAINGLASNAGFTMGTTTIQFIAPTTTQWYTTGATYA